MASLSLADIVVAFAGSDNTFCVKLQPQHYIISSASKVSCAKSLGARQEARSTHQASTLRLYSVYVVQLPSSSAGARGRGGAGSGLGEFSPVPTARMASKHHHFNIFASVYKKTRNHSGPARVHIRSCPFATFAPNHLL